MGGQKKRVRVQYDYRHGSERYHMKSTHVTITGSEDEGRGTSQGIQMA